MAPRKKSGPSASPYDHSEDEAVFEMPEITLHKGERLNVEAIAEMKRLVTLGVSVSVAATAVGAGTRAGSWARKARNDREAGKVPGIGEGESIELYWLGEMEIAKALFEAQMVAAVQAAAPLDWKAAAWLLERRAAKRYHNPTILQLQAKNGQTLEISAFSTEKLIALAKGMIPDAEVVHKQLPADVQDADFTE